MSYAANGDWIDDNSTFVSVHAWCHVCDPDGVPEPWTPHLCNNHLPSSEGLHDRLVSSAEVFLSGSAEAGGDANRQMCDLLHPVTPRRNK